MAEELELAPPSFKEVELEQGQRFGRPIAAPIALWAGIALLTAVGCLGISRELSLLWLNWMTDPLRSIGMFIPPVAIVLTLRVWQQTGWEMRGNWWGILAIGSSYSLSLLRQTPPFAILGKLQIPLIPTAFPVYAYGCGVVLLFFGPRVWRKAWFSLGLLLLCQPVPHWTTTLIDVPLQSISAQVARSFAALIGLTPTSSQLRLMFAPDFGMFIAPGCDGIRGAVAMGYVALVLGYLKRVSLRRWAAYVTGAVLLGYFFNFIRLCVLVLYYRIAIGHPALQNVASQADYVIGFCLFLIAALLFLWMARQKKQNPFPGKAALRDVVSRTPIRDISVKGAAFAILLLAVLALPSSALRLSGNRVPTPASLAGRMPKQIGAFKLTRTWFEQQSGKILVEAGSYSAPQSDEITFAVWVAPVDRFHNANLCWLTRGVQPDVLTNRSFVAAKGNSVEFSTGFYHDGLTDSMVASATCTPRSCLQSQEVALSSHDGIVLYKPELDELGLSGNHPVSVMIRIDKPYWNASKSVQIDLLSAEAQRFISGLDPLSLSQAFQ